MRRQRRIYRATRSGYSWSAAAAAAVVDERDARACQIPATRRLPKRRVADAEKNREHVKRNGASTYTTTICISHGSLPSGLMLPMNLCYSIFQMQLTHSASPFAREGTVSGKAKWLCDICPIAMEQLFVSRNGTMCFFTCDYFLHVTSAFLYMCEKVYLNLKEYRYHKFHYLVTI